MSKARELSQRAGVDGALSNRNKVINGSFLVWQRSDSAYANSGYASVDRFMMTRGRIRKPNTEGYTGEDNTGAVFDCMDGGIYSHFDYYIEDIGQKLHGKTMTLSFKMKSLTGSSESLYLEQTGTDAFDFGGSTYITVPTEWTTFTFTGTVVSTGHVGGVHLMRWYLNPTGSSAVSKRLQIDEVQFEEGDTVTPFEHRSFCQELALCQRFFEKSYPYDVALGAYNGSTIALIANYYLGYLYGGSVEYIVEKRTAPTLQIWSYAGHGSNWHRGYNGYNETLTTSITLSNNSARRFNPYISGASSQDNVMYGHWAADAELYG